MWFRSASSLLGIVYRPPNIGYLQEFQNQFLDLQINYKHSIIFGDFNADILDTYDSMQLKNFIDSPNLYCVPYRATHHLRDSNTLLNLCVIDDSTKMTGYGQHGIAFSRLTT